MRVSAIAAMDRSGAIGIGGRMPWHLPRDLKRFRKYTWDKPVIMGRNTFLSLAAPLAGRFQIVLTRKSDWMAQDCHVVHSVDEALSAAADRLEVVGGDETMIIGGGLVFQETVSRLGPRLSDAGGGSFRGRCLLPARGDAADFAGAASRKNGLLRMPRILIRIGSSPWSGCRRRRASTEDFDLASWLDRPVPRVCEPA